MSQSQEAEAKAAAINAIIAAFKDGKATLKQLLNIPDDEIESTYSVGLQLLKMEKYQTAASVLSSLTVLNPYDVRFWRACALAILKTKRPKLAIIIAKAALSIDEDDLPSRLYRGEAAIDAGMMELAMSDLKRVAASDEKSPQLVPFVARAQTLLKFLAAR